MTEKQQLSIGINIKSKLIKFITVTKSNQYIIVISPQEWHKIFETERCKELKLLKQ